ncbi:MAG: phosphotransferase enzyme family protein [Candidatus Eiseniibacteriota bacterium]
MASLNYFSDRSLGPDVAERAIALWDLGRGPAGAAAAPAGPVRLTHLGTSGNAVYRVDPGPFILRLTDPAHRTFEHCVSETSFLSHLDASGVRVAAPVCSSARQAVERVGELSATVLTWAPGEIVRAGSRHWNEPFFRAWGRALGSIHAASRTYAGPMRWEWHEENLIAQADRFLPSDDGLARSELARVRSRLVELPMTPANYGMTHADFGPQNFHYDAASHGIASFDFGNCCRHWYVSDLAISLSTLRREPDRELYKDWILGGYREVADLDPAVWAELDTFLQLRILYVYLSRLEAFGSRADGEQRATIAQLRGMVAKRFTWS